jgi:ABC-type amino acid transport substrate-binding protein
MTGDWKRTLVLLMIISLIISIRLIFGEQKGNPSRYILAMVTGTDYYSIAQKLPGVQGLKYYSDVNQVLSEVASGRVDAAIIDHLQGLNLLQENHRKLRLSGNLLEEEAVTVTFKRKDRSLRQKINWALAEVIHNGTYARINYKYFGCDILKDMKHAVTYPDETAGADGSWNRVQQTGKIGFAMKGADPPFNYTNDQHELTGFDVELAQAVCEQLKLKSAVIWETEDILIEGLHAGNYDGIWGHMEVTGEQLKNISFSDPCYITGPQLVVRDSDLDTIPGIFEKVLKPSLFPPIRP